MATHIKTDGTNTKVTPKNGKTFTLRELQGFVGGTIDIQDLPNGASIVLNDNGKLEGMPKNEVVTSIWKNAYPIEDYPYNNDELIVGDILFVGKDEQHELNDEEDV